MKKIIIITILALIPFAVFSQKKNNNFRLTEKKVSEPQSKMPKNNLDKWQKGRRWAIGVQVGTDIGGAIPVPLKYIPSTFNPYPQLNISVGARGSWSYNKRWSVHAEVTYKKISMNADARVENQKFTQPDGSIQYFSGTAKMKMDFTMIELPLYAKVALSKRYNDFVIIGAYYAYNLKPQFITTATNGYIGVNPGEVTGMVTPDDPMEMNFNSYLGNHDAGIIFGYERRIWDRANIGVRFMVGFKDIFQKDAAFFDYQMWQMRGSINLEYDLFLIK